MKNSGIVFDLLSLLIILLFFFWLPFFVVKEVIDNRRNIEPLEPVRIEQKEQGR